MGDGGRSKSLPFLRSQMEANFYPVCIKGGVAFQAAGEGEMLGTAVLPVQNKSRQSLIPSRGTVQIRCKVSGFAAINNL